MRIKLSEKYQKEREEICNKIITILDLKEDNAILLCDLDELIFFFFICFCTKVHR